MSQKESSSDARSLTLMHRVSALEKHVQDIQAKLFLCKQETKTLSSGRGKKKRKDNQTSFILYLLYIILYSVGTWIR